MGVRSTIVISGILVSTLGLGQAGRSASCSAAPGETDENTRAERPTPGTVWAPMHGLAIQISRAEDVLQRFAPAIDEIADLGANVVLISISGYQQHAATSLIGNDEAKTPSEQDVAELIRGARRAGLRVVLMPKILLDKPRGTEWRGRIQPPSWDQWFDQYRRWIVPWARLAEEAGVEMFMVGSELVSAEKHTTQWRRVIRDVRQVFHGQLSYSANWDHYSGIEFWSELDLVGLTTYYELADHEGAAVEEIVAGWGKWKEKILRWQRQVGKPILLTEVGWASQPGCAIEAWNYLRHQRPSAEGLAEQARCYEAFCRVWANVPQLGGTFWWEWTPEPAGPQDFGYTPKGKPAEQVLRRWFADQLSHNDADRQEETGRQAP